MIELFKFQRKASTEICNKLIEYLNDPLMKTKTIIRPFYQNLSAITGAGKTVILADALALIRAQLPVEPIVLWLSKGSVVVSQTFENLYSGKYKEIVQEYCVMELQKCTISDIEDANKALLLFATVAKLNQKDKEQGNRKVYEIELDKGRDSLWNLLKNRITKDGFKRSLIIVYDEGHNLSDQQTNLLINDLNPEALITASATLKLPNEMEKVINSLKEDKGWRKKELITTVSSADVVDVALIKKGIKLSGYNTSMELAIDDMLLNMKSLSKSINEIGVSIIPKAIYVTNTNMLINSKYNDRTDLPFDERMARPIVIWKHLVNKGIDPSDIAVYCNLKFDRKFPPPNNFNIFSGGDNDFYNFREGNFKHIIFNLSLQEGWDDPECYCAYIDKDMGSKIQVSQVIGRVLRQPDATHYKSHDLNLSYFYIRSDEKTVFKEIIDEIEEKILKDIPELDITFVTSSGNSNKIRVEEKFKQYLPEVSIDCSEAKERINHIIKSMPDYRWDKVNTVGTGNKMQILKLIAKNENTIEEWVEVSSSNKVTARWIFKNELKKYYKSLENLCDIENKKFDALVEYNSIASNILREIAEKVVDEYIRYSTIVTVNSNSKQVNGLDVNMNGMIKFKHSIHEGYSGLNSLEKIFAKELDKYGFSWLRNLNKSFFEIPLLDKGDTNNFNPDFIVWTKNSIVAIDTKGDHILAKDKERKLFTLEKKDKGPELKIRLVSEGKWERENEKKEKSGYTVWLIKNGKITPYPFDSLKETIDFCIKDI